MKKLRSDFLAFGRPNFGDEEIQAVSRTIQSGWVGMGPETIAFEQELSKSLGSPHVVTVNSCTSALFLSLLVSGVGPGDEVICPSLTWCSTANAALYLGARPVFCDVDCRTLNVTTESILNGLTDRTKAVVVVHMGGLALDVKALREALPERVFIVEDAAHALGASYANELPVGSAGNLTCFSFYANKNLSTGEGGAIALTDGAVAERLRSLRQHGLSSDAWKRYIAPQNALSPTISELGYKMNYSDLQASIGRVQLRRQPEFRARRLVIAQRYYEKLALQIPGWEFQSDSLASRHARHLLLCLLPVESMPLSRDQLVIALRARNIGASIHYTPLHKLEVYRQFGGDLPITDQLAQRIMTLPISASMSLLDADYVIEHIFELLEDH